MALLWWPGQPLTRRWAGVTGRSCVTWLALHRLGRVRGVLGVTALI